MNLLSANRTRRDSGGALTVDQGKSGRFFLSWNPDDDRFYVSLDEATAETVATFRERRNAVRYGVTH